jgi:hypothetical protein
MAGSLEEVYRQSVAVHLSVCRDCELRMGEVRSLRSGLKHLPFVQVPPILNTRLRVIASRERARRMSRLDFGAWKREAADRARLFFDNLLKPFALPAAGGILASLLCFGVIVDNLQVGPLLANDIPIGISSEITLSEASPFCVDGRDVMVQLTVDSKGNVTDFEPQESNPSPEAMREIGNLVLYSSFTPARRLGQPISSKRLFYIRHISIKG